MQYRCTKKNRGWRQVCWPGSCGELSLSLGSKQALTSRRESAVSVIRICKECFWEEPFRASTWLNGQCTPLCPSNSSGHHIVANWWRKFNSTGGRFAWCGVNCSRILFFAKSLLFAVVVDGILLCKKRQSHWAGGLD